MKFLTGTGMIFLSQLSPIPEAEPPDCVMDEAGINYRGTQWITAFGKPCLIWIHDKVLPLVNEVSFPEASLVSSLNYCRNPTNNKQGPYCYILDVDGDPTISYCSPRRCLAVECRRSGNGADYIGLLNTTLSNLSCIKVQLSVSFLNSHYFLNQEVADNVCSNSNYDPGGPWCFVSDSNINFDRCDVPDCSKNERSTIIVVDSDIFKRGKFFVAPHWKSEGVKFWLKNWNPKLTAGLIISLFNRSSNTYYSFTIGAEMNKKLVLSFHDSEGKENILKEAVMPYLIKSGKWTGFWLKLPMSKFEFGLEGATEPLFDFHLTLPDNKAFLPTYVHYGTFNDSYVGIHFKAKECLAGIIESSISKILFPLDVWLGKNTAFNHSMQFHLRGLGITVFEFFRVPSLQYGLIIKLDRSRFEIISNVTKTVLFSYSIPNGFSINEATWSALEIKMNDSVFEAKTHNRSLFEWTSPFPLIYYFFSVSNEGGKTIWAVNCEAPDIDGDPRNGGWGEWGAWDCSVPCGGGQGIRYRRCDRPPPNLFGLGCEGPSFTYGICNTHKCGTLSEDTMSLIKNLIHRRAFNQKVTVGDVINLKCDSQLVNLIRTEAPESELEWFLNEQSVSGVKLKAKHLNSSESSALRIGSASSNYTGVYVCILHSIDRTKIIIHVAAVIVQSNDVTLSVRETRPISLVSHSSVLQSIFPGLRRQWILNGTVIHDIDISNLTVTANDQIENALSNHSGEWTCVVFKSNHNLSWTTAWMRVKVLEKPNFLTYLMEENVRKMRFDFFMDVAVIKIILICLYVALAVGLGCFAYYYDKWVKEYHVETK